MPSLTLDQGVTFRQSGLWHSYSIEVTKLNRVNFQYLENEAENRSVFILPCPATYWIIMLIKKLAL